MLTVLITNYNTSDFVELSLHALEKLTQNPYNVIINDNGSPDPEKERLLRVAARYSNVRCNFRETDASASLAHAEALNILIGMVETKYTVVLDSDAVFLCKGWDQYFIDDITEKIKIVGTPLGKSWSGEKPYDFPFQFAVLFETEVYKGLYIDCRPRDIAKGEDTCWEWKPKFEGAGYKGKCLAAKNTRLYKEGPLRDVVCVEFYHHMVKAIFCSHFGRGTSPKGKRAGSWYGKVVGRIPLIGSFFRYHEWRLEKEMWLDMCRRIIDSQNQP